MRNGELKEQHKKVLKLRDALRSLRDEAPRKIEQRLRELAAEVDITDRAAAERKQRATLWAPHAKDTEDLLRAVAPLAALWGDEDARTARETERRAALPLRRPALADAPHHADTDFLIDGPRHVFNELRRLREDLARQTYYQRLRRSDPQLVARLAVEESAKGDKADTDLLAECAAVLTDPDRPQTDELRRARALVKSVELPRNAVEAEEEELLDEIVQATREIRDSRDAVLRGTSTARAEHAREVAEAVAAGVPDAARVVAESRLARQRGERQPPKMQIPISGGAPPSETPKPAA